MEHEGNIVASREEEEEEEEEEDEEDIYKQVCENISHSLSLIRSYAKETIIPDARATYLSIVDAAMSGPHQLETSTVVRVLGVSRYGGTTIIDNYFLS